METQTLQKHLARGEQPDDGKKRLYVIDESSMASTKQMLTFVERLKENDRVLFIGDTRQHEAVEAGRPYAQLQDAGLRTAHLDEIIRQKDPALKEVVEQLARGEVRQAIGSLNLQGRVHEISDRQERIAEIAREDVRQPDSTLVVSPDNESRREINGHIHRAMQDAGQVKGEEYRVHVLFARQDITGADRQLAQNYERCDVIRYSKGSKPLGIDPNCESYLQVRQAALQEELHQVDQLAAADDLPDAILTDSGLKITPLDATVPHAAQNLIEQVAASLPHVKITELLLEVDNWTGFTKRFTHLKRGEMAKDRIPLLTTILAMRSISALPR